MLIKWIIRTIATITGVAGFAAAFLGLWYVAFEPSDAKSLQYILWKRGFHTEKNIQDVLTAMYLDPSSTEFVVGKTPAQLRKWLPLVPLRETSAHNRGWYGASHWKGRKALFVPNSICMIVFDYRDRATDLIFMEA